MCSLVDVFHWSLGDIANTDIELLLPFLVYYPYWKKRAKEQPAVDRKYADEVGWL